MIVKVSIREVAEFVYSCHVVMDMSSLHIQLFCRLHTAGFN